METRKPLQGVASGALTRLRAGTRDKTGWGCCRHPRIGSSAAREPHGTSTRSGRHLASREGEATCVSRAWGGGEHPRPHCPPLLPTRTSFRIRTGVVALQLPYPMRGASRPPDHPAQQVREEAGSHPAHATEPPKSLGPGLRLPRLKHQDSAVNLSRRFSTTDIHLVRYCHFSQNKLYKGYCSTTQEEKHGQHKDY